MAELLLMISISVGAHGQIIDDVFLDRGMSAPMDCACMPLENYRACYETDIELEMIRNELRERPTFTEISRESTVINFAYGLMAGFAVTLMTCHLANCK